MPLRVNGYLTRGHVAIIAIITKTESTYVMIESTLRFDDVKGAQNVITLGPHGTPYLYDLEAPGAPEF